MLLFKQTPPPCSFLDFEEESVLLDDFLIRFPLDGDLD